MKRLFLAVYRVLLRALPADFRARYGLEALTLAAERMRHAKGLDALALAARELDAPATKVHVAVASHESQHLYLVGAVDEQHQVVPYRGPETIVDLLQRVGLSSGASPGET